jgi:UDP-2,3-diacylglucosamine hydrolase
MDRPERAQRFSRWVNERQPGQTLLIVGDLCDFWMGSRCSEDELLRCEGLKALVDFRERGGSLEVMAGNHDFWLTPFYERRLGARILSDPHEVTLHGIRLHLVHGHLLGARRKWKAMMESQAFFQAFGRLPGPMAGWLDARLERKNQKSLDEDERRHLEVFRQYADTLRGRADLVVIGHVHRSVDESGAGPRLIVLGGWQKHASYLCIDPGGATFHVLRDHSTGSSAVTGGEDRSTASEPKYSGS